MKKIFSNYLLGKIFGAGLCLFLLAGLTPLHAQDDVTGDDNEADEEEVAIKRPVVAKTPTYPMREVKGIVIDAATKAPLAGVRVQSVKGTHGVYVVKSAVNRSAKAMKIAF